MSCITESLACGLVRDAERDCQRRLVKAVLSMQTPAPTAASAIWRETLDFARGVSGHVVYERHQGEKKRATATLVCMSPLADQKGAVFYTASLSARKLFKGSADYVVETSVPAIISGHAQHRAIQALGPDPKVYGRELFKHAVAGDTSVAATFSALGIVIWDQGVAKTFIPSDRLDKWAAPYARWQSGRSVDGVVSAASSMAEALAMVGGGQ